MRTSVYDVPLRRMVESRPNLADLLGKRRELPGVEVLRHEDLLNLRFSFVNLRLVRSGGLPVLKRLLAEELAFLVVDVRSQHATELALFQTSTGIAVQNPRPPSTAIDPDTPNPEDPPPPPEKQLWPAPPLAASLAGSSRLVFKVADEAIPYNVEGLLGALGTLELSVAPQATPPEPAFPGIRDFFDADLADSIAGVFERAGAPSMRVARGRRRVDSPQGGTRVASELIAVGRMRATAAALAYRFGTSEALGAIGSTSVGGRLRIADRYEELDDLVDVIAPALVPSPPRPTQTSIELPWRLQISPNEHGAFAHSALPVEHEGRYELWHTRLGVRSENQGVDERDQELRTFRAVWARDFDLHGFTEQPDGDDFPPADGSEDYPKFRKALNSRDRMMLVHETSNFRLRRRRPPWMPPAVKTNRLMLTALGGWLDSHLFVDRLPEGGLTIEEWKHRAALGRDHEVKVVYSGFLLPFGHKASLIKLSQRKLELGAGGKAAYLFQRMFIAVREPERRFRDDKRAHNGKRLDLTMPYASVRILTSVTPDLDEPKSLLKVEDKNGGHIFEPHVRGEPFQFDLLAVDLEGNIVEFAGPLTFMERDRNVGARLETAAERYNAAAHRDLMLRGQRIAYAESQRADDTKLATQSTTFEVVVPQFLAGRVQDEPRFAPILDYAHAVVPAMSALSGQETPVKLRYPLHYAAHEFENNAAELFLEAPDKPELRFTDKGDRSGGLVTPSIGVSGLSRVTGPIGGSVDAAVAGGANFDVGTFFGGIEAKLFGAIPLEKLFAAAPFGFERIPKFVTQVLDVATVLKQNVQRIRNAADAIGAPGASLKQQADVLLADLAALLADPANPPNLTDDLGDLRDEIDGFVQAVEASALSKAQKLQLAGVARRVEDQLQDAVTAAKHLVAFAQGSPVPEVVTARLDWSTDVKPWPPNPAEPIFAPDGGQGRLSLAVEIQAPARPGQQPSALVACSLSPFELRLIAPATFIVLRFEVLEFSMQPGKKPDVDVRLGELKFDGPLEFVNTLKDVVPMDGFSDPPYLDASAEGIKAGFDLAIPDLALGVFALTNVSLGAHFKVPFLDESIETAFNFSTRENPFRLQVALFAGGGFFGITITPDRVRVLEAALEFGAAVSIDFGVASGSVSVMAGIYFRLETDAAGKESAQLTGYYRMRGEVEALGLVSVCIELYLSLTYETATEKAIGRATLTIEVEVAFFSASVEISCEKKFSGKAGDPSFVDVMGLPAPGAVRPWDTYVRAFAED